MINPAPLVGIVILIVIAALCPGLRSSKDFPSPYVTDEEGRQEVNSSALAAILGEFRTSLSDFIWIKTELYEHQGIRFQPHVDEKEKDVERGKMKTAIALTEGRTTETMLLAKPIVKHADHPTTHALQWIPAPEKDFRGFIGDIDREVHPWGKHRFAESKETLPWYVILTVTNPHHSRAYIVGGWLLMKEDRQSDHLAQAERFLREGVANNPDSFPLRVMLGRALIQEERWKEAIQEFEKARNLALKTRSKDGKPDAKWTDDAEEDFGFAVRYIPFIQLRQLNDVKGARISCKEALSYMPNDRALKQFYENLRKEPIE